MESGGGRSDPRSLTREEEAVKRNTDCVYFLASPLTCKKGSECEYRHSEGARVNPRDCKFWFSGSCLNPKCLFRHPPLDGPVGNSAASSGPIMMTASQVTESTKLPTMNSSAYNSSRNNVPCYYFQNGGCLKGDKCPFMHGTQPASNSIAKQTSKVFAPVTTQLDTTKKDARKPEEFRNQQNSSTAALRIPKESIVQPVKVNLVHKSSSFAQSRNVHVQSDSIEPEAGEILGDFSEFGYTKLERPLNQQLQSSRYKNGKGAEEGFTEFSPGFDVLVNNVVKHDRDGFRSKASQGGRTMNLVDGFDRDQHSGAGDFRRYGKVQNGVDGDQHRTFSVSERILDRPILPVRGSTHRLRSPDRVDETDLRYRLTKQRRLNGSLSATDSDSESKLDGRHEQKRQDRHTHNPYRDQRQPLPESTISNRLRGRITVPRPLSQEFSSDLQGGGSRGRQRCNLSPVRTLSLQRRLGERLSRKPIEDSSGNGRNTSNQQKSRDGVDTLDFAGPRSLAELKGVKTDESSPAHSTKVLHSAGLRDSVVSVPFDGPKPLSTLLKSSREARPEDDAISAVSNDSKAIGEFEAAPVPELQAHHALETSLEDAKGFITNPEEPEVGTIVEEEGEIGGEVHFPAAVEQITYKLQAEEHEAETGDAVEDEELDYTDQRDGEYDYDDTVDGGDYNAEDDENIDPMNIDDEEEEDEDEDDFAKKIGLIFS
ncbi:zinc finger CCCH domain-containing protein 19-like [Phalaenopsis equestris]|uniref:zinc finger CCCH domain-containing protein 19-like n=1 Tax=Phalaenopsis equestris TaxID=78828 RepID=UPI0009E44A48|nr:zinc finger CCCH domain-containing protein 19-like [Phalaenopsis equestris]